LVPNAGSRELAAALARAATDPTTRAKLLPMAQKWFDMANCPRTNFDAILKEFNDQQMQGPGPA
jgi:hypothetical protein